MYAKVIKWLSWALLLASVVIGFLGFIIGFEANGDAPVDTLLYWAYAMVGMTLAAVLIGVLIINGMNDPKSLVKLIIVLVATAAVIGIAYLLAPGTPAVGLLVDQPTEGTLKFTDTILNLTYFVCGAAVLSVLVGAIVAATRK